MFEFNASDFHWLFRFNIARIQSIKLGERKGKDKIRIKHNLHNFFTRKAGFFLKIVR